jgi:polyhydroxybutyrate depolymerase
MISKSSLGSAPVLMILFMIIFSEFAAAQQTVSGNLLHNGLNRSYRLRLPSGHQTSAPTPLVFNLHGYTSNGSQQEIYSGMNVVADSAKFAVCYPNGVATSWNVGWSFGSQADDVGFISALIEDLVSRYGFDRSRIYACGMSNGGFMSFRLACELSGKIAAVASVTGSVVPGRLQTCNPGKAVPAMAIHGTADDVVPYNGGPINLPIETVVNFWTDLNGCNQDATVFDFPNVNTSDNSTAIKYTYDQCDEESEVVFIKVIGGGHTWPGSLINNGVTNRDFNASAEIWRFFRRFSLPDLSSDKNFNETSLSYHMYPNPATDELNVKSNNSISQYEVMDMNGKVLLSGKFSIPVNEFRIPVQPLVPGLYFLKTGPSDFRSTVKFVKI